VKRLQVLVALKHHNRLFNLSIPDVAIYLGGFLVVGLLVLAGYLGQLYIDKSTDYGKLNRLIQENYQLKNRLATYAAAVDTFRGFLARTEEMDNRLRCASGLRLIPAEVRLMGIGGPLPAVNEEVGNLLRRARFEESSLSEIEKSLDKQKYRLGHIPSIWPVQGWVTSGFGLRRDPFTDQHRMHNGIDIVAPYGTAIVAVADGRVIFSGWKSGWGRCIEIDHGNRAHTFYAHCSSLRVKIGDRVTRGKKIANLGSSGRSTGAHLHYGVKRKGNWVNPRNYIISPL